LTLYRPRRPHGSQTMVSVGVEMSDRVSEPSRGMETRQDFPSPLALTNGNAASSTRVVKWQ
jgi:hypothetical protein